MRLKSKLFESDQNAFLLIEIILAIALFSLLTFVVLSAFVYGRDAVTVSGDSLRASEVANEGIEALHNIADSSYTNLSSYTNGTTYYLSTTSSQWSLSTTATTINGIYTPAVVFAAGPTSNSRQITLTVSWKEDLQRTGSISAVTYLANWQATTTNPVQTKTGLLVYANGGTSTELIDYRLLQSTGTWTNPVALPYVDPATHNCVAYSVKLFPAQTGANKVVMDRCYNGSSQYLYGIVWNGSSWGNVELLAHWSGNNGLDSGNYNGGYLANGTFVAVYNDNTNIPKYNTWNGTSWGTQGSLPAISNDSSDYPTSMEVYARPGANQAMVVILGNDYETVSSYYNGSSWSAITTHASNGTEDGSRMVDFAWSPENPLQGAIVYTNSSNDLSLQLKVFTAVSSGTSGTWGSQISTTAQPNSAIPVSVAITGQPTGTEEWIACDKDLEGSQHIYCYTLQPTKVLNPVNQILTTNTATGGAQSFDLTFGLLGGTTGLSSYSDNTTSDKLKRLNTTTDTWDSSPLAAPTAESVIYKTRIIPEPASNDAMVLMIDSENNLYSIMYNGTANGFYATPTDFAWTIHNANGPSVDSKWFDFAWDQ
jgi:hypothetical protein